MNKGIRFKVFALLLGFMFLYGFTTFLNLLYNNENDKVNNFNNTVNGIHILLLKDVQTINDFFILEVSNNLFFNTGYSSYLEEHRVYMSSIKNNINTLLNSDVVHKFHLNNQLKDISNDLEVYERDFNFLLTTLKEKHTNIEDFTSEIKEFKVKLDNRKIVILDEVSKINKHTTNQSNRISTRNRFVFELSVFIILLISIVFSLYLSKQTTKRIITLSEIISNFVASKFTSNEKLELKKYNDEIGQLIENFLILRKEVWFQINFLEENIKVRTKEIQLQKDKILEQNDEILAQRDEVIEKNTLIQKQNTKILDSIRYAKTIQEAFLPDVKKISEVFPENFIIWRPKDLVSGDFYWFKNIKNKNISILAVADCTGHGVPGGFMSMLGNSLLNEIVLRKKNYDAATILNNLRTRLLETLQDEHKRVKSNDGMDIALVIFDHENNSIQFAGANIPLYLVRNGIVDKIWGDKMPIGNYIKGNRSFINKRFDLESNDAIYLLSDGFVDQFGHDDKRKFRSNQLRQILENHFDQPMQEQGEVYRLLFDFWKGKTEQTDDVLFIGLKPVITEVITEREDELFQFSE